MQVLGKNSQQFENFRPFWVIYKLEGMALTAYYL